MSIHNETVFLCHLVVVGGILLAAGRLGREPRAAVCVFNAGNALVEIKEFDQARERFARLCREFPAHDLAVGQPRGESRCPFPDRQPGGYEGNFGMATIRVLVRPDGVQGQPEGTQ